MKNIELLAVTIFSLTSCTSDLSFDNLSDKSEELKVSVQIENNTRSVVSGSTFPVSSSIGLFIANTNSTFTPFIGTYTYTSDFKWNCTGSKIYVSGKKVTAYAYYPSTAKVVDTNTLSSKSSFTANIFSSAGVEASFNAQGQTDYMTAKPVENINSYKNSVQLSFKHVLSKINFVINKSLRYRKKKGQITKIKLSSQSSIFAINGTFNISSGSFTPTTTKQTIEFTPATDTYANPYKISPSKNITAFGLVAPSTSLSKVTLEITVDGQIKKVDKFPKAPKWEAGKSNTYTISIE